MVKKVKELVKHPLFSGSFVMVAGSFGVNVINYFYHLVMGRILGPIDYGVLASLFSILYIIGVIPTSSSFAIVKFISSAQNIQERRLIYRGIRKLLFYIASLSSLVLILASPIMANFLRIEETWAVVLVALVPLFSINTLANQATLQGILEFTKLVGTYLISSVAKFAVGILLVIWGLSVTGAMGAMLLGAALAYFLSVFLMPKSLKKENGKRFDLKPFLKYALPVLLQALAFTSFFTVDVILVKHFFPPFEAGLYAALSTLGKIIYFAAQPVTSVMFPIVSGRKSRGQSYRKVFLASLGMTGLIAAGVVLVYYLFPGLTIGLLYGEKYLSAQAELVWMALFMSFYTLCYALTNFLLSIGKTKMVILPLMAAVLQLMAIFYWHKSILEVIQISLSTMVLLLISLVLYSGYTRLSKNYVKK